MPLGVPSGSASSRAASQTLGGGKPAPAKTTPVSAAPPAPAGLGSRAATLPAATGVGSGSPGAGGGPRGAANSAPLDPYASWAQGQQSINNASGLAYQDGLNLQIAQTNANYGQGVGGLQAQANFDQQYLWNDENRLGADRGLWDAKNGNIATNWDIAQSRYNNQAAQNTDKRGFVGRTFDNNNNLAGLQYDKTNRQVLSDNTARGATFSQGFGDTNKETARTRDLALSGNQIGYDSNMNDLKWADEANWRAYRGDDANHSLATSQQDREKSYLDQLGSDYGIKTDQIQDALTRGISKLGLDYGSTIAQLANLKDQGTAQSLAQASALSYQLLNANLGASGSSALKAGIAQGEPTTGSKNTDPSVGPYRTAPSDTGRLPNAPVMAGSKGTY